MALTLEKLLENSTPKPFELPSNVGALGPTVKMRDIIGIASMIFAEQNLWAVPARTGLYPVKVSPHVLGRNAPLVWLYSTLLDEDYYLCRKTLQGAYTQVYAIFVPFDRIRAPYTDNLLIYINGKIIRHPRLGPKSAPDSWADWVYNKLRNLLELVSVLPNRENYRLVPRRRELPTLCASKLLETGSEALKELLNEDYYFEEDSDKLGFHFTRQIHVHITKPHKYQLLGNSAKPVECSVVRTLFEDGHILWDNIEEVKAYRARRNTKEAPSSNVPHPG